MTPQDIATKFRYGTREHGKLERAVAERLRLSETRMQDKYKQIAKNEDTFQSYIHERDVDARRRLQKDVGGVPDYRTIEIPYSYAVAMTAHTYYSSVFLSRTPALQLAGRHGEAENNRIAIEALLNYQMTVGQMMVALYIWLLDPAKAGYGVIGHYWDEELITVTKQQMVQPTFLGMPIPGRAPQSQMISEDVPGYSGNRIYNIRPQDFFPDPRVSLLHFQKGEFAGRYVETSWQEIYEGSRQRNNLRYFNFETLSKMRQDRSNSFTGSSPTRDVGSSHGPQLPDSTQEIAAYDLPVGFIKGHEVALRIVPRDWGVGDSDRQEVWMVNRASNGVIFGFTPLGDYSGKFPFDVLVDEIDGYSIFPKSMIERVEPMNNVLTWLVNSHFYNVRQTLNNQFVVDPTMVVMKDVTNPEPGKIIRLKPEAYGKDVRTAITQLVTADVTGSHMSDTVAIQSFIERLTGINDSMMGQLTGNNDKTATEVRTSTGFGVNRAKTKCEWWSTIGFSPLTQKLVQRTQQNFDKPRQFRVVGDQASLSPTFMQVTPDLIAGFFDYEAVDGTLPVDRFAQANLWKELMAQMAQVPQIFMQYDIARIFGFVANLGGLKNLAQFKITPDQAMQQQVQAGNVVPLKAVQAGAGSSQTPNMNEPGQVPNLGATG